MRHGRIRFPRRQIGPAKILQDGGGPGSIAYLLGECQRQLQLLERLSDLSQRFRGLRRLHERLALFPDLACVLVELCRLFPCRERLIEGTPLVRLKTLRHQGVRRWFHRGDRSGGPGQHHADRHDQDADEPDHIVHCHVTIVVHVVCHRAHIRID